jgi:hypothetical protein
MSIVTLLKQIGIVIFLVVLAWIPIVNATDGPPEGVINMLLTWVATNNYDGLIANAAPALKSGSTGITKEKFVQITAQLSPRLKKGYKVQYLANLQKGGNECSLWKITFQGGGDDLLGYLWIQEDKVAGFLFQNPIPDLSP